MIELNKIYNEDCINTMVNTPPHFVDIILTSPPYNTARSNCDFYNDTNKSRYSKRYEDFNDMKTDEEYIEWTVNIFNNFDKVLKENKCIIWNISYGGEKPWLMWNVMSSIQTKTNFRIADCIVWKKKSALPNNVSPNKLTRICEFVFVMARESELDTFYCNKGISSESKKGQTIYNNVFNFIEAPNNDENCPIHKATYSSLLCRKLLQLYSKEGDVVYDPFMGTGTTAIAAIRDKRNYIGSELSDRYCAWAENRIKEETSQLSLF